MAKKKVSKKEQYRIDWKDYHRNIRFVMHKGYRIYPQTKNNLQFKIVIELGVKKAILSTEWEKKHVDYAIVDAYRMIYNKHNTEQE